jgi:hypothetical protein
MGYFCVRSWMLLIGLGIFLYFIAMAVHSCHYISRTPWDTALGRELLPEYRRELHTAVPVHASSQSPHAAAPSSSSRSMQG